MRLSIAEEHPGDLLLTVTESFSEYYVSGLRKLETLLVPCAFSRISLRCCNLREVLQDGTASCGLGPYLVSLKL